MALPTAPSRSDPANFATRADAFVAAMPTFETDMNALQVAAAASAVAAAAAATNTTLGTSTTSVAIGTGSKVFTTEAGKAWTVGSWLTITSSANPTVNYMIGQVTAYSTTTLTVNVASGNSFGSGTLADWVIALAGARGAAGATPALDTDVTLAANSDTVIASQRAVKSYVDTRNGWTQIATVVTTSGTAWSFTSIPSTYSRLLIVVDDWSTNFSDSPAIRLSGNNGSSYSAAINVGHGSSTNYHQAVVEIPYYTAGRGRFYAGGAINLAASPSTASDTGPLSSGAPVTGFQWVITGGINAIQFVGSAGGTGDRGSITLYGI